MQPISHERAQWCSERIKVLDLCLEKALIQIQRGGQARANDAAYNLMLAERYALGFELEVLLKHFEVKP